MTRIDRRKKSAKYSSEKGVYTRLEDLLRFQYTSLGVSFLPRQPVRSILSGRYGSRLRGRGLNFEELRRYQVGDDVRNIDWKVTARCRTPHVRVYTEEKDRQVVLVVDQRINMFFGTKERLKSVTACEVSAVAAWRANKAGDRVGAIIFNDTDYAQLAPSRGNQCVVNMLSRLCDFNHRLSVRNKLKSNASMLNEALCRTLNLRLHESLIVVVSDFDGVNTETEKHIANLAEHNDVIGVLVYDPSRLDSIRHKLWVTDGELSMELNLQLEANRKKIEADFQAEQTQLANHLRKFSAPLLAVCNQGDIVEQLRKLLNEGVAAL